MISPSAVARVERLAGGRHLPATTNFDFKSSKDNHLLPKARAEHYEMSRYGTLTWANELGLGDAVGLLDATLQEEKNTDAILTKIAESVVNQEAE